MLYQISGAPVPASFPFSKQFNNGPWNAPPLFTAAIAWRETLSTLAPDEAAICISGDGGHGLCQLTSSWPDDWMSPAANIEYAWDNFLNPAMTYWHGLYGYSGSTLIRLVAATFNEGLGAAITYHNQGNVDAGTTNEYGAGVLAIYESLLNTGKPV